MNGPGRPFINIVVPDLFGRPGGIARICRSLCLAASQYCARSGIQLSVLALNDSGTSRDARYLPNDVEYLGFSGDRVALALEVIRRGHARNHRFSIFGHVNLATPALLFPLARGERTRRFAVMAHGIEVWARLPAHRRVALSCAREIWSVSAFTARQIEDLQQVPEGILRIIHNGLDPFFDSTQVQSSDLSPPGQRFILSVSRLSHSESYKGLDTAISAMARATASAPDIKLKIVGSGDDRFRLEGIARSLRISDRVEFLGSLSDEALLPLYQDCAFFTLPSKKEGFGLVFLEAMARSRAVVASDAGGTPEVVVANSTGLLVPFGDDRRLGHAFAELWNNPAKAARLGADGLRRVDERFRFNHYVRRIGTALDRVLAESASRPTADSARSRWT